MVVEDDLSVRFLVKETLKYLGHEEIVSVDNVESALGYLKAGKVPELMFLDLILPGEPGYSLAEYVRENHPEVRIIIVTGLSEEQVMRRLPGRNYDAVLYKPFDHRQLKETAARFFSGGGGK
jgi:CheY-like chemotaxis protein